MFAHSVIPHHHHASKQEADKHHQQEHFAHNHNGEHHEGHGHTPHFVHSPDFETYIGSSSFKLDTPSQFDADFAFISAPAFNLQFVSVVNQLACFPAQPPPYIGYTPLPNGLRGSPVSISLA